MKLVLAAMGRRVLAMGGGIAAALVLCLAIPGALAAAGCLEIGIFGTCLGMNSTVIPAVQPVVLVALVAFGASFAGAVVVESLRHCRLARALSGLAQPASLMGEKVGLVPGMSRAVVAGVARPAIYCSPGLMARLEEEELKAVILHERHHRETRAPLRLVILTAVGRFIDWSAKGRRWLVRRRAAIEVAADAHVLSAGLPRAVLARAIVKLYDAHSGVAAAGFATAADLRLRALLGDETLTADPGRALPITALIAFVACIALG